MLRLWNSKITLLVVGANGRILLTSLYNAGNPARQPDWVRQGDSPNLPYTAADSFMVCAGDPSAENCTG